MAELKDASVRFLHDVAQQEYERELSRCTLIDSKVSIALPIVSAYFLSLTTQCAAIKSILNMPSDNIGGIVVCIFLLLLYFIALLFSGCALYLFVRAISPQNYQTIDPVFYYDEEFLQEEDKVIITGVVQNRIKANYNNRAKNDKRMNWYSAGWFMSVISVMAYMAFALITGIFMSGGI